MNRNYLLTATLVVATTACSKHPSEQVVADYLNQKRCQDRAAFILDGDENEKAALTSKYADETDCVVPHGKIDGTGCQGVAVGEYCSVAVEKISSDYCVKRVGEAEFKIDWLCSTGWNSVPLKTVKANKPGSEKPVLLRVTAVLSDQHEGGTSAETEVSVVLSDETDSLQAWMPYSRQVTARKKQTLEFPAGVKLKQLLADGRKHKVLVEVAYLKKEDGDQPFVSWLYQEGWRALPADELAKQQKLKLAAADAFAHPGAEEAKSIMACCNKLVALAKDKTVEPTLALGASLVAPKCLAQATKVRDGLGSAGGAWSEIGANKKLMGDHFPAECAVK